MSRQYFPTHTVESAPAGSRSAMESTQRHLGHLPEAVGRMAESPEALTGFLEMSAKFERSTMDPVAREVVVLTIATRNVCHLCVAMHTAKLTKLKADPAVISALRDGTELPDPRLAAVRRFTLELLATAGSPSTESLDDFLSHGFTTRNALEVVLGIGTYTLSTFANRLTEAPVDERMAAFAWEPATV
ncbi:carboxymuconolactone decarboxylase family protein [Kitasatospora sp. NBC_01287]|uniref:carboxymuconolactone decarboxylase family protein n=1 Tax=Kitasatospora sp. NBC_01287 TaxID=2903573 RepID=UPI00225B4B05|nr:carboxymuconolactone decarboxylase family protein [Kitasatospora sp. NBC_01287]MCX4747819.1 carboxymuconolactone decarboxylase family protein [Kitasatospora sp. NBC_01287]